MAYSSNADLMNEMSEYDLAKLTGDPSGAEIDENRIEQARADADSIINGYLSGRYPIPLPVPIDPLIVKLSRDLTVVHLYEFAYGKSALPNTIVWRRINSLKILKEIASGIAGLMLEPEPQKALGSILSAKDADREYTSKNLNEQ